MATDRVLALLDSSIDDADVGRYPIQHRLCVGIAFSAVINLPPKRCYPTRKIVIAATAKATTTATTIASGFFIHCDQGLW